MVDDIFHGDYFVSLVFLNIGLNTLLNFPYFELRKSIQFPAGYSRISTLKLNRWNENSFEVNEMLAAGLLKTHTHSFYCICTYMRARVESGTRFLYLLYWNEVTALNGSTVKRIIRWCCSDTDGFYRWFSRGTVTKFRAHYYDNTAIKGQLAIIRTIFVYNNNARVCYDVTDISVICRRKWRISGVRFES